MATKYEEKEGGFKASETLLGIETSPQDSGISSGYRFKASETLLGIETIHLPAMSCTSVSFKASETLLGIETGQVHL